jgi:predicted RNase H-like HicB family nuclease
VAGLNPPEYRVLIERDESGSWLARVPAVPGCHSHGRTLEQVRRRIREALSLWVDEAAEAWLVEDVELPPGVSEGIRRSRDARAQAERARTEAHDCTAEAARMLVRDLRVGLRDAGDLLGLSYQRIQQIVGS